MIPKRHDQTSTLSQAHLQLIQLLARQAVQDHLTQQSQQASAKADNDSNHPIPQPDNYGYSRQP